MEEPFRHFSKIIDEAGLETQVKDRVSHILKDEELGNYKGMRFIWLLKNIKSGRFMTLSTEEKKEDLEIFFSLFQHKNVTNITLACYLFFEGDMPRKIRGYILPQKMIEGFIAGAREEKSGIIKEMIWDFLLSEEKGLERCITPDELVFGLWLTNPIVRNKIILFLLKHFAPEIIVSTVAGYSKKTGKALPARSFSMLLKLSKTHMNNAQRNHFTREILNHFELPDKEINCIVSDYLKGINRFDLIRIFSLNSTRPGLIKYPRKPDFQLAFDFIPQGVIPHTEKSLENLYRNRQS